MAHGEFRFLHARTLAAGMVRQCEGGLAMLKQPEDTCSPPRTHNKHGATCCAMRQSASARIQELIDRKRHQLAGLEKLLKIAEFSSDDPALESILWEATCNLRNDGPFGN